MLDSITASGMSCSKRMTIASVVTSTAVVLMHAYCCDNLRVNSDSISVDCMISHLILVNLVFLKDAILPLASERVTC
jgi:hypothetical protein